MTTPVRASHLRRRVVQRLDVDGAFFWLLISFLLTLLVFLSLHHHPIQLAPSQVVEYERRSQFLSNSTVYIVETLRPEMLLSRLDVASWRRISSDIDLVAFVFDDLPLFLTDDWVRAAERSLLVGAHAARVRKGLGVGVFGCGCVLPNEFFNRVEQRLDGFECLLLPGLVLRRGDVHWLDTRADAVCRGRAKVLGAQVAHKYADRLSRARATVRALERELAEAGEPAM